MRLGDDVLLTNNALDGRATWWWCSRTRRHRRASAAAGGAATTTSPTVPSLRGRGRGRDARVGADVYSVSLRVSAPASDYVTNGVPIALAPLVRWTR
jgi:hypothetical protein